MTDDSPISFIEKGNKDGKVILMLHGWGTDHRYFDFQEEILRDYRIILPDLPGFGSSPTPSSDYSLPTLAEQLIQLMQSLGGRKYIVIGHSMGGMIAQELVLQDQSKIDGLVLASTTPGLRHTSGSMILATLAPLIYISSRNMRRTLALKWALHDGKKDGPATSLIAEYAESSCPRILVPYVRAMKKWSSLERLEMIQIPCLIVHGEHDRLISHRHARLLKDNIHIAKVVTIPDSGHTPHLENPEVFNQEITSFLKTISW